MLSVLCMRVVGLPDRVVYRQAVHVRGGGGLLWPPVDALPAEGSLRKNGGNLITYRTLYGSYPYILV
jgi:hypothetical protein